MHSKPDLPGPRTQVLYLKLQCGQYWVLQWGQFDLVEDPLNLSIATSTSPVMSAVHLFTKITALSIKTSVIGKVTLHKVAQRIRIFDPKFKPKRNTSSDGKEELIPKNRKLIPALGLRKRFSAFERTKERILIQLTIAESRIFSSWIGFIITYISSFR